MASRTRTRDGSSDTRRGSHHTQRRREDTKPNFDTESTVEICSFIDDKEENQIPFLGSPVSRPLRRWGTSTVEAKDTNGIPGQIEDVGARPKMNGDDATNIYLSSKQNAVFISERDAISNGTKGNGVVAQHTGNRKSDEVEMTNNGPSSQQALTIRSKAILQPESKNIDLQQSGIKMAHLNRPDAIKDAINKQKTIVPILAPGCQRLSGKLSGAGESEPSSANPHQSYNKPKGCGENSIMNKSLSSQLSLLLSTESETTLSVAGSAQNLITEEDKSTIVGVGVGPGKLKYRPIKNRYGPTNSPHHNRFHKPQTLTRTAHITAVETKIDESVLQILFFIKNVSQKRDDGPSGQHDEQFKVFLDANKEIVRGWRLLEYGVFNEMEMSKNIDCIHSILVAWGNDFTVSGSWVSQAIELTELCLAFAREWEVLTRKRLGVTEWLEMRQATEGTLAKYTTAETNESMEYIYPESVDINRKNSSFKRHYNSQVAFSTISAISHENRLPQTLYTSPPASTKHEVSTTPNEAPTTSLTAFPLSSTAEEGLHLHQRLSKIEAQLSDHHTSEQTIIRVLDMQRLLIQDITDAIFGNISIPSPNDSEERAIAKRTGLLMMSKALADDGRRKMLALEEDNSRLKAEVQNLKIERQVKLSDAEQEIRKLKEIVGSLDTPPSTYPDTKGTSWVDEAWDCTMEMYWPQGNPTQDGHSSFGGGIMPVLRQAGRGQGSGSGIGSCAVM